MEWSVLVLAGSLLFSFGQAQAYPIAPNPDWTSGDLCSPQDRDFMARKYPEKIVVCQRNVDTDLKHKIYTEYSIPRQCQRRYTIDHFIPLSIGGNNSPKNLWPEHKLVKAKRFDLEQEVFDAVATGKLSQQEAIDRIRQAKMHPDPIVMAVIQADPNCDRPSPADEY